MPDFEKAKELLKELRGLLVSGSYEMGLLDDIGKVLGFELWKVESSSINRINRVVARFQIGADGTGPFVQLVDLLKDGFGLPLPQEKEVTDLIIELAPSRTEEILSEQVENNIRQWGIKTKEDIEQLKETAKRWIFSDVYKELYFKILEEQVLGNSQ